MSSFPTEFLQICKAVAVGFAVMGFIGYFVKLIHIPMYVFFPMVCVRFDHRILRNNILVYVFPALLRRSLTDSNYSGGA